MTFQFSRQGLAGREKMLERLFEILPGMTSWTILIGMVVLSFRRPVVSAVLMIAFLLYWLIRLFYMTLFLVISYLRLAVEKKTDWMMRAKEMDDLDRSLQKLRETAPRTLKEKLSLWIHEKELLRLQKSGSLPPSSDEIYHLILLPVAKEPREIVEPGLQSLTRQKFPLKRMVVVCAVEERAPREAKEGIEALRKKYRDFFLDFLIVVHPDGLPGEARVKGANAAYAAKASGDFLKEKNIPFENVLISCFDADTVVSPDYFGCLTYHFMICPERTRASFQPIPVYHNNIWDVPAFARVLDIGSSFFQFIEATNPEKLVTFSSHSMSFKALVEMGYWPVDMISDDSAIFWKAYLYFDGDYRVIPMYATLSMDVVSAPGWWTTVTHVYKQKRRWAWGVENFPIVMRGFLKSDRIPFSGKIKHALKLFESHVAWATWSFLLTVVVWLPALLTGREFSDTVLYYSAPRITSLIFHLAFLSLATTIFLSIALLPKKGVRYSFLKKVGHVVEWGLIPLSATFLSALPALDAQTRLLFGKYMEFWVTDKNRV